MKDIKVQTWFFAGLFVVLLLAVVWLLVPFFTVLLWSTLLYILISPLYHRIIRERNLTSPLGGLLRSLLAAVFSIGTAVLILLPLLWVGFQLFRQLSTLIKIALEYLNSNPLLFDSELERFSALLREVSYGQIDYDAARLRVELEAILGRGIQMVVQMSTHLIKNLGAFLMGIAFMIFSLFFFYMDGPYLSSLFLKAVPIRKEYTSELVRKFMDITRNLFLGYILVALVQGVVAYIIFMLFRVQGALVFAIILFFCSFIPILGAGAVWGPIGLFRLLTGDVVGGILFLIFSGIFISTLDNVLRPLFLKDRIKLHPLVIFFSILGGVASFGFNGLVLGPVLIILFLTVLDLFLSEHGIDSDR